MTVQERIACEKYIESNPDATCECDFCCAGEKAKEEARKLNDLNAYKRGFNEGYEKALYDVEYKGMDTPKRIA